MSLGVTPYSLAGNELVLIKPAYAPLSAHHPHFEFSSIPITLSEGTIMEQLAEKRAEERDLQCPFRL